MTAKRIGWQPLENEKRLASIVEIERNETLWGISYTTFTSHLLRQQHGDGAQLLSLAPMRERPRFILVAVDSSVSLFTSDDNAFIDRALDKCLDLITDEHGWHNDDCGEECKEPWPHASWYDGVGWSLFGMTADILGTTGELAESGPLP